MPASRIAEYVQDRRHSGRLVDPTTIGHASVEGQAPSATIYLRIDDGVVQEGRFQASGCGYLMACCAAAIELSRGRYISDCLQLGPTEIILHLGGLPGNRGYCAELAIEALRDALLSFSLTSRGSE